MCVCVCVCVCLQGFICSLGYCGQIELIRTFSLVIQALCDLGVFSNPVRYIFNIR